MRVIGVDLAASASSTGAVALAPIESGRWSASEVCGPLDDDALIAAADGAFVIGIDSPLGWPRRFIEAVRAHSEFGPWPGTTDRSTLTHRETDRAVRGIVRAVPLSVSADKLGSVAMRCALLQRRWADEVWGAPASRDGSGTLVEVYPAAAYAKWEVESRKYKDARDPALAMTVRRRMVAAFVDSLGPWLDLTALVDRCIESDHVLDALACALVAVAAWNSSTSQPTAEQREAAQVEGWIHIPSQPLVELAAPKC